MRAVAWRHTQAGIDRRRAQARVEAPRREIEPETVQTPPAAPPAKVLSFVKPEPEVDRLAYLDGPVYRPAKQIIDMVACWHGLDSRDIYGPLRFRDIVEARTDAMAAVRLNCRRLEEGQWLPLSQSRIGLIFDKDHSTVISALRRRGLK